MSNAVTDLARTLALGASRGVFFDPARRGEHSLEALQTGLDTCSRSECRVRSPSYVDLETPRTSIS